MQRCCLRLPAMFVAMLLNVSASGATVFKTDHVIVNYTGITEAQAASLGRVAEAARKAAIDRYGFDVPQTITVNVDCSFANKVRLFTDGNDTYTLRIRTGVDLAPPGVSRYYNLYGMCHELGHVVMFRTLRDRGWMSGSVSEAWAHFFGSQIVDDVYSTLGADAWWMPYDYRTDGMMRLRSQLESPDTDASTRQAAAWMKLTQVVGEKKMPQLFGAWQKAKVDPTDPSPMLRQALLEVADDDKSAEAWWLESEPILVDKRPLSDFAPATGPAKPASGKTKELALDDGKSAGKSSIAGSGHAVLFESPSENATLTSVKIFGSRYGAQQPPADEFHVYLCDDDGKQIKDFAFPYKLFLKGDPRWVTLKVEPTQVPKRFIICVAFSPSATKGVFVHHDANCDGDSRTGLPGNFNEAFGKGDWMIRAVVAE